MYYGRNKEINKNILNTNMAQIFVLLLYKRSLRYWSSNQILGLVFILTLDSRVHNRYSSPHLILESTLDTLVHIRY